MFLFLTVLQAIVGAALVGVILMQRSEGGGLGIGGSPGGMLSARGAADFLTRSTKWLAVAFVALSIALAAMAVEGVGGADTVESTLDRSVQPAAVPDPLGQTTAPAGDPAATPAAEPAQNEQPAADDPLAE